MFLRLIQAHDPPMRVWCYQENRASGLLGNLEKTRRAANETRTRYRALTKRVRYQLDHPDCMKHRGYGSIIDVFLPDIPSNC